MFQAFVSGEPERELGGTRKAEVGELGVASHGANSLELKGKNPYEQSFFREK